MTWIKNFLCPACERVRDRVPAGEPTLGGEFFAEHRGEIMNLVRHAESTARAEHSLERIIEIVKMTDAADCS